MDKGYKLISMKYFVISSYTVGKNFTNYSLSYSLSRTRIYVRLFTLTNRQSLSKSANYKYNF